ncbi:hypothetical protein V6N13_023131 [Hibiscus sabdariffa]|uniref:Uncharacterized protein n=1 Tax=Hibiscus sabdariffa TaxID=183260 RepID=A0ABR2NWK0_9ROSI
MSSASDPHCIYQHEPPTVTGKHRRSLQPPSIEAAKRGDVRLWRLGKYLMWIRFGEDGRVNGVLALMVVDGWGVRE